MADWGLSSCERQEFCTGNATRGTANGKGSYSQLLAATAFAYDAIELQMVGDGGGGQCYLVDIAIGAAGSEVVVVPNILLDTARGLFQNCISISLPVAIPAGSRLSARCQEPGGAGTRTVDIGIAGRAGGHNYAQPAVGTLTTYGSNTATSNGVLVDPGAVANTYGAWTEITSGTAKDHQGLMAILGTNQSASAIIDSTYYFRIGIGASGSELVIAEWMSACCSGDTRLQANSFEVLAQIPAGTRLAMASKCTGSAATTARNITGILMGY